MTGVAEVVINKEVSEIPKVENEEKCGLDMSSYQDLSKSEGINGVSGGNVDENSDTVDGSIDNSYVFVNGAGDSVGDDPVVESEVSPKSIVDSQSIVDSGETGVCVVQESVAVPVGNVDSLRKDVVDEVPVANGGLVKEDDRIVGNADAEPEEVKDQVESETSVEPTENQESQAAITESMEPYVDTKPELLEVCVQPAENKEPQVVVLESNKESVGGEETKTPLPGISDEGDENKVIKEANLQPSDELSLGQDARSVVLESSIESEATNESKSASPDTIQTVEENEETNLESSDDLSQGQNYEVVVRASNEEPREESNAMSLHVKESGDENKESDKVQGCESVVDAESGDSGERKILLLDLKVNGDGNKESGGEDLENHHELQEESVAVPVGNVDSLQKDVAEEVPVATADLVKEDDRIVGNADAEPDEVKTQLESETSVEPTENQESQAAITESVEPYVDTKPDLLEVCVQPVENKESQVLVLEANKESAGGEETKTLLPDIKEANLEPSDEQSLGLDSRSMVLEVSNESEVTNESKSASPDTIQSVEENEETKESNSDSSEDLSHGQNYEVVVSATNVEPGEESNIVSLHVKESGYENKEIHKVQGCETVVDAESGDSGEIKILLSDLKETGDENKESGGEDLEIRHQSQEVQKSQNSISEACGNQSVELESMKIKLEEHKDLELSNEFGEGHESSNMALEASVYQSGEVAVENENDLTHNHKSENVIKEANACESGELDDGLTAESVVVGDSQNVALDVPESATKGAESGILDSEQQHQVEPSDQVEERGISKVAAVISSELRSCLPGDGRGKELDEEQKIDLCSQRKEIHGSDTAVDQDIQVSSEVKSSDIDTDAPFEATSDSNSVLYENKDELDGSHVIKCSEKIEEPSDCLNRGESSLEVEESLVSDHSLPLACSTRGTEIDGKPIESDENLPSGSRAVSTVQHEIKPEDSTLSDAKCVENVVPCPVDKTDLDIVKSETVAENGSIDDHNILSSPVNDERLGSGAAPETIDSIEMANSFQGDDVQHCEAQDVSGDAESSQSCSVSVDVKLDAKVEDTLGSSDKLPNDLVATRTVILDSSAVDKEGASKLVSETADVKSVGDDSNDGASSGDRNLMCQESSCTEKSQTTDVAASTPEHSAADATEEESGVGGMMRPFNFLIRIPRFDDEKLRERIRHAQLQVEAKTKCRDAFRLEIQKRRANLESYGDEFEKAIIEDRDARKLVKQKRVEIDSLQSLISRVKNVIAVEDIDTRVSNIEHMMQHETLDLKEEKQFIRELKQLKHMRAELSTGIGNEEETLQALEQKDQIEGRLKVLKKELDSLKNMALKTQAVATAARRKYDGEHLRFRELQDQFKAADGVRQATYAQLLSLRKELFEKNKAFRTYKEDSAAASDYAFNRHREGLHRICVNQVETVMELWNKNDEFRKEYVRCNLRSTVRRLGTLDGRSLGPDEEPPAVPSYASERVDSLVFNRHKISSVSQTVVEQTREVTPVEVIVPDGKSMPKVEQSEKPNVKQSEKPMVKVTEPAKSTLANGLLSSAAADTIDDNSLQTKEELLQTNEELELARKAEDLRKEEEAAKLKELRRLEELAKAREAQERKIRNDKKAQMKAELRAQKEAEQREKEREKRLRKKERRKAVAAEDNNNDGENAQSLDSAVETPKDPEIKEIPPTVKQPTVSKRHQIPSQFVKHTKSIPPPLRNRNRRKVQQWMWVTFTSLFFIALFFLGNLGVFSNLRPRKSGF